MTLDRTDPAVQTTSTPRAPVGFGATSIAVPRDVVDLDNNLAGVGLVFRDCGKDGLRVQSLQQNGPATRCGKTININDTLISIDQMDVRSMNPGMLGRFILGPVCVRARTRPRFQIGRS